MPRQPAHPRQPHRPDDLTICVGEWKFQVSGNKAYVEHADHPGDIHITAKAEHFTVEVLDEDLTDVHYNLDAPYDELKEKT